ncbi:MAG: 1-acyl-sn-glycerol-3-phosphate acyltransferase [Phycisphaerae bacterium]|nr:1-acyl-sn-glycerol-3-phosphate acyltransferase [Phycisphaerae bacterium]
MRLYYRFCRLGCQIFYLLLGKGRVFGTERVPKTGGVILACNHQSFFDPVLATLALPRECDYMARDTLFRNALFRRLIESLNAFPVRRGETDTAAIKETLRRLKAGRLITVFPEGTRTLDGRIGPLQPGAAALAKKAKVPIIPVVIEGAFEAWPRHHVLPRPGTISVRYGTPIIPAEHPEMNAAALMREVARQLRELQTRERSRRGLPALQYADNELDRA